jgi:hypothetical protein
MSVRARWWSQAVQFPPVLRPQGKEHTCPGTPNSGARCQGERPRNDICCNWSGYETMKREKFGRDLTPPRVKYRTLKSQIPVGATHPTRGQCASFPGFFMSLRAAVGRVALSVLCEGSIETSDRKVFEPSWVQACDHAHSRV